MGNIGSENTRSYTVVGDTVNLAARLERANRVYGTRILVGESTVQALGLDFEIREIDTISVKGKTETTRVFEVMSMARQLSDESVRLRERCIKLGGCILTKTGTAPRRFFTNVCKFDRMTVRPVSFLSEFNSYAEILPARIGMGFGI